MTTTSDAERGFWDTGPQLTKVEFGPEPSLREIIRHYYTSHGMGFDRAEVETKRYIKSITQEPRK